MSQTDKAAEEMQKIDLVAILLDFLRTFRRMWVQMVVLAVIGAVVMGFLANSRYQPYYTASATFTITIREEQQSGTSTSASYFDNSAAEQMATTFPSILTSGVLQRKVAAELGTSGVPGTISASVEGSTNLFTLSVRDTDPERAYKTLQAVINNYPSLSEVIIGKVNMNILDETGVPKNPNNPKDIKDDVVKGAAYGAGIGVLWMVLVTLLRKTIRREDDFPKYINQRCLGSIPYVPFKERSKQVERRLNITDDSANQEFKEAIRIIRNKVERSARENGLRTILVTSALAGEGKSTIAVNLAISMAQEGKKVALVDCDLRNPSDNEILKIDSDKGLVDYLNKEAKFNECMYNAGMLGVADKTQFLFIPGGKPVADGANLLGTKRMEQVVITLSEFVDYVILDSAPVGLLTDAGVLAQYADGAVFIVKKDYAKASHILDGIEHLAESNIHMIGCVLNGD